MEDSLVKNKDLYGVLKEAVANVYVDIHAIYEPDGSDFFGDCYCAAMDLFSFEFTFRVYFRIVEGQVKVEHIERWHFG